MIEFLKNFVWQNAFWIITVVKIVLLLLIVLTVNAYLTWFERKAVAHIQSRWGPHRVGPHGLLQPAADGLKFLFKKIQHRTAWIASSTISRRFSRSLFRSQRSP